MKKAQGSIVSCTGTKTRQTCWVVDEDGDVSGWECKKNRNGTWSCTQFRAESDQGDIAPELIDAVLVARAEQRR